MRDEVAAGRQVYVVCPLIDESETLEVRSAEETFAQLSADELAGLRIGLLHGRLTSAEKEQVMTLFRAGALDVLVATTVIEVGVDVANATIMVILDAYRFGIAQLHQLRGRVGRGRNSRIATSSVRHRPPTASPASKRSLRRPMDSPLPRSISICGVRARSWASVRRVATT